MNNRYFIISLGTLLTLTGAPSRSAAPNDDNKELSNPQQNADPTFTQAEYEQLLEYMNTIEMPEKRERRERVPERREKRERRESVPNRRERRERRERTRYLEP